MKNIKKVENKVTDSKYNDFRDLLRVEDGTDYFLNDYENWGRLYIKEKFGIEC